MVKSHPIPFTGKQLPLPLEGDRLQQPAPPTDLPSAVEKGDRNPCCCMNTVAPPEHFLVREVNPSFEASPPEHFSQQAEWLHQHLARLEWERDQIRSGGAIAQKGAYIESYTAIRRRKSGKVVQYVYYRLRQPYAPEGEAKHLSLGKIGSGKYTAAQEAIARRNALEQVEWQIRVIQQQLGDV